MTEDELKAIEAQVQDPKAGINAFFKQRVRVRALVAEVRRLRAILEDAEVVGCNHDRTRFGAEITLAPGDLPKAYRQKSGELGAVLSPRPIAKCKWCHGPVGTPRPDHVCEP